VVVVMNVEMVVWLLVSCKRIVVCSMSI